jgi:hypothetical protein
MRNPLAVFVQQFALLVRPLPIPDHIGELPENECASDRHTVDLGRCLRLLRPFVAAGADDQLRAPRRIAAAKVQRPNR